MSVVSIHPEELLDKLSQGRLAPAERELVESHLRSCDVCRFELAVSIDFQDEAGERFAAHSEPRLPLSTLQIGPERPAAARRRSRHLIWAAAAAMLIASTGAVASVTRVGQSVAVFLGIGEPQQKPQGPAAPAAAPPEPAAAKTPAPAAPSIVVPVPSAAPEKSARPAAGAKAPRALAHEAAAASGEASGAQALFTEANQARRRGDLAKAGGLYRDLQQRFPGSQEAALSQVTLSMLLLDRGDAAGALAGFDKYLARSRRPLEAEAMVGRARALGALGSRSAESLAWQKVQRKYPGSVYARQASDRLAALGSP